MKLSLQTFRSQFFSGRRYDQSFGGVASRDTSGQTSCWVVSRGLCSYRLIDLSHIEKSKRQNALVNQLSILSPYENFGYWVSWVEGMAQTWVWDENLVESAIIEHLVPADDRALLEVLPESAFSLRLDDGMQLCESTDGYVIQHWHEGLLHEERFWQHRPSEAELLRFARGVGGSAALEDLQPQSFLDVPWQSVDGLGREYRAIEPRLLVYGALALSAIFLYQLFSWVGLQFLLHNLEQDYLAARQASQPVLEVREATLALQDGNHVIAELGQRSQLDLMAEIVRELPAADEESGALMSWKFQADELTFVINRPTAGLEDYAAALDQINGLDEIDLLPNDRARQLAINVRMK